MKTEKLGVLFWFLLIIWLLTSCKSQKQLVSTDTKTSIEISEKRDIVSNSQEKVSEKQEKVEKQTINEDEITIIFKTEYDTEKPVNPDTGKPPVKSETKTKITKNSSGETTSTENITKVDENITNFVDKSTVETKINQVEKVKQESPKDPKKFRYVVYLIWTITGVAGTILVYFNRSKIFSFIKNFLK